MKKVLCVLCAALLLGGWTWPETETYTKTTLNPRICRTPEVMRPMRGKLDALPMPDEEGTFDLRDADLTGCGLSGQLEALQKANFTNATKWPASLPDGFDPAAVLEQGKDPGLGVKSLHERGITGKGVGIGIIDQTLLVDHQEYRDQLRYYNEHGRMQKADAQMHGPAVASIAVGKTTGVAPDALLYYIADEHHVESGDQEDCSNRAKDIDELIALNQTLPENEKIRVISISNGWMPDAPGADKMNAAVARARAAGIEVVWISDEDPLLSQYFGMGRRWMADPNSFDGLYPANWRVEDILNGEDASDYLLTPMDRRTVAAPEGQDIYAHYRNGGMSWVMPYVAGLYALACQADPQVTMEEFTKAARETARPAAFTQGGKSYSFGAAIDPAALIERLEKNDG